MQCPSAARHGECVTPFEVSTEKPLKLGNSISRSEDFTFEDCCKRLEFRSSKIMPEIRYLPFHLGSQPSRGLLLTRLPFPKMIFDHISARQVKHVDIDCRHRTR